MHEHVVLFKAVVVQWEGYSFPSREFALGMLSVDSFLASAKLGCCPAIDELFYVLLLDAHIA